MTAITADGVGANEFVQDAYKAPTAELIETTGEAVPNRAFSIEGRLGVLSNLARMALAMVAMGVSVAPMMLLLSIGGTENPSTALMLITGGIFLVGALTASVYMIVNTIKRLHDINMSGWFILLNFIPLFGVLFGLYVTLKPGTKGPNKFAGATKPTSTAGKVVGGIMLALYLLAMIGQAGMLIGAFAA